MDLRAPRAAGPVDRVSKHAAQRAARVRRIGHEEAPNPFIREIAPYDVGLAQERFGLNREFWFVYTACGVNEEVYFSGVSSRTAFALDQILDVELDLVLS